MEKEMSERKMNRALRLSPYQDPLLWGFSVPLKHQPRLFAATETAGSIRLEPKQTPQV